MQMYKCIDGGPSMLPKLKPGEDNLVAGALTTCALTSTECNHNRGGLLDVL